MKPVYNLTTLIPVTLTVCGCKTEVEATVTYNHLPAERGYREPGGGQIDPDYPESIEIQSLKYKDCDLTALLTDAIEEAIQDEVLGN